MIDIDEHPIHLGCRFASTRTDLTNTPHVYDLIKEKFT